MSDEKTSEAIDPKELDHMPKALRLLAAEIQAPDHVPAMCLRDAAAMIESLAMQLAQSERQLKILQVARSSDLTATKAGREIERDLQAKEMKALLDVCRRIVSEYETEGEVSIGCIEDARAALKSE